MIRDGRWTVEWLGKRHSVLFRMGYGQVLILGSVSKVRAKIEIVDSFCGHADHSELLDYFERTTGAKQRTWLVHGEPASALKLREGLMAAHTGSVEIEELGGEVEF